MRNRRELRGGVPLDKDCKKAHTIWDNGDNICCGLHHDPESFMLAEYDVIEKCRRCGAWHENYNQTMENKTK